jgi:hypothetical protein
MSGLLTGLKNENAHPLGVGYPNNNSNKADRAFSSRESSTLYVASQKQPRQEKTFSFLLLAAS